MALLSEILLRRLESLSDFVFDRVYREQVRATTLLETLIEKVDNMATDLTALQAEVARNTTIASSVKTLVEGLRQQITDLGNATTDPVTAEALAAMAAQLAADNKIEEDVIANTPAAPPV